MQTVGREPPLLHQPGEPAAAAVRLLPSVGGNGAELTVAAAGATEAATMGAPARYARALRWRPALQGGGARHRQTDRQTDTAHTHPVTLSHARPRAAQNFLRGRGPAAPGGTF